MNHNPDEKQLEELLETFSPDASRRLDQRLSDAPWTPHAIARRRVIGSAIFTILTFAILAAATPQGRAFAQNILRYFVRAEGNTRPVPTLAPVVTLDNPDISDSASPEPFLENRPPFEDTCGGFLNPHCSLDEIRAMVAFPIKGLGVLPDDVDFMGATGGPEQVTLVYAGEGLNGTLSLSEEPVSAVKQLWQVAVSATVESISVGEAVDEYVQGGWFSINADDSVTWNADTTVQTLRWEADGILYTMVFRAGKMGTGILLDKTTMLELARHLSMEAVANPDPEPDSSKDIELVSQQAGFPVTEPGWLPEGYVFLEVAYTLEENTACLFYTSRGGDNSPLLVIAQRPENRSSLLNYIAVQNVEVDGQQIAIPVATEPLNVGGAQDGQAVLVSNGVDANTLCPYKNFSANQALYWQSNGKDFVIFGLLDQHEGGAFVSRLDMQRLAESLTGVTTIPHDRLDPQRLHSVEDADQLAGFDVKAPSRMVSGVQLDHAVYLDDAQTETVKLIYTPGKPTRGGIDYGIFITQAVGAIRTLEEVYLWGEFEYATINSQNALYRKACWDTVGGNTECYQELYWDELGVGYDIKAYFPGALEKGEFFAIAESLR